MIVLKNTLLTDVDNLRIKFIQDVNSICKYQFAVVTPNYDNKGNPSYEQLDNDKSLPYYAEFEPISDSEEFLLSKFSSNKTIGIWIVKELNPDLVIDKSCETLLEEHESGNKPSKIETFGFEFLWDIDSSISDSDSSSQSNS
jgi:hypothetical protein